MKTKSSTYHRHFAFAYVLLVAVIFCGCNPQGSKNDVNIEKSYEVKVIDSCEYIYVSRRPWSSEFSLAHKGNCKFSFILKIEHNGLHKISTGIESENLPNYSKLIKW